MFLGDRERKDSTSSTSPEEKPKRPSKRKPKSSAGPSFLQILHEESAEPIHQAPNQGPTTQSQPETQETHRSLPCPSGHTTPPEEEYVKAITNKGVMVAEAESGFTDVSISDAPQDNSPPGNVACSAADPDPDPVLPNQQSQASGEFPANVQAMGGPEGEASTLPSQVPKKCARFNGAGVSVSDGGANLRGASGGASVGSFSDPGVQRKDVYKKCDNQRGCDSRRGMNGRNSTVLISYKLAGM